MNDGKQSTRFHETLLPVRRNTDKLRRKYTIEDLNVLRFRIFCTLYLYFLLPRSATICEQQV
jgi:DNA-binding transcriptional MerR regulator